MSTLSRCSRNLRACWILVSTSCSPVLGRRRISLSFCWWVLVFSLAFCFCWNLNLPKSMILQTGGFSWAATSTRSSWASRAISRACEVGITPTCSPAAPISRMGVMRICSLTRVWCSRRSRSKRFGGGGKAFFLLEGHGQDNLTFLHRPARSSTGLDYLSTPRAERHADHTRGTTCVAFGPRLGKESYPAVDVRFQHMDRLLVIVRLVRVQVADRNQAEQPFAVVQHRQMADTAILHNAACLLNRRVRL